MISLLLLGYIFHTVSKSIIINIIFSHHFPRQSFVRFVAEVFTHYSKSCLHQLKKKFRHGQFSVLAKKKNCDSCALYLYGHFQKKILRFTYAYLYQLTFQLIQVGRGKTLNELIFRILSAGSQKLEQNSKIRLSRNTRGCAKLGESPGECSRFLERKRMAERDWERERVE